MNLNGATRLTSLIIVIWVNATILGQSPTSGSHELVRQNPDGWFTLNLPKFTGKVERFADLDGGYYESDNLGIKYRYWTFQNTPNWLRGRYAKPLILACSAKSKGTRTRRTWKTVCSYRRPEGFPLCLLRHFPETESL